MVGRSAMLAVCLVLALTGLLLSGCTPSGTTVSGMLTSQEEGIWVTGTGEVSVNPDMANLRLGVEALEDTVAEARLQANQAMDGVISALTRNGVASDDIQTRYFSIQEVTRWDSERQEEVLVGYRVSNMVTAKIRDISSVGVVIDAAAEAGGDLVRIQGLDFTVEDPTGYYEEVRQEAMADAKAKAEQLAELGGVRLGRPTFISEGSTTAPPVPVMAEAGIAFAREEALKTPISPGEIEVSLTVQVVYAIR